ncbi:MAG: bifunctional oligoribonuclease/PAP phosphatase NrnA [Oscillospiraceae bacterium]|nr:bifunctional oligoribonuclease/PAP phosphatase NrnA [Oscillospiraceae bacterium]
MSNCIDCTPAQAAALLLEQERVTILIHRHPDGDTIGSGMALLHALRDMGKQVRLHSPDPISKRYGLVVEDEDTTAGLENSYVVAVDVADPALLGRLEEEYGHRVDLCVDHHPSNKRYAKNLLLRGEYASCCEAVYELLLALGCAITPVMANGIYLGASTDTGCFRYGNTTANTHYVASKAIEAGANHGMINRVIFETVTPQRMVFESRVKETLQYFYGGHCALMYQLQSAFEGLDVEESELEGISNIPRTIEGVEVGVTVREQADGSCRISLRSSDFVDASEICQRFGGGGHKRAAGCTMHTTPEQAGMSIVKAIGDYFPEESL